MSRFRKRSVDMPELHESAHFGQQEYTAQDAQKGQTSHPPNPGAPRRAVPRTRPQRATGDCHLSGRWLSPSDSGTGTGQCRSQSPEPLSEARTPLADFFSILVDEFASSTLKRVCLRRDKPDRTDQPKQENGTWSLFVARVGQVQRPARAATAKG